MSCVVALKMNLLKDPVLWAAISALLAMIIWRLAEECLVQTPRGDESATFLQGTCLQN